MCSVSVLRSTSGPLGAGEPGLFDLLVRLAPEWSRLAPLLAASMAPEARLDSDEMPTNDA